jgi:signal transduction histidine kinase
MKKRSKKGHVRLTRQIFLGLLGVASAAVILYGLLNIVAFLLLSILLCYLLARYFSNRIEKNISLFKDFFKKATTENQFIDQSKIYYKEFYFIAEEANLMVKEREIAEKKLHDLHINIEKIVEERTLRLEETNKELESFSISISHDLRAPLRAILGFSQILSSRHRESLNEESRQYMDYIVEASNRMEQLINDLLSYSRLVRKKVNLNYVDLNALFESTFMIFKTELENIEADFLIENEIESIISDKTLLHHVFSNLVSNAIKYRRENVPLIIKIGSTFKDGFHTLYISDNGIGIPDNYNTKIFEVFQRLHSEETHPGTGIGLASVKKAVLLLGGVVWVESVINEGSTFFIKLPVINSIDQ